MITEIILVIFAMLYYVFSVFVFGVYIQEPENMNFTDTFCGFIATIILSPIAVPIILCIEIGEWIKNN